MGKAKLVTAKQGEWWSRIEQTKLRKEMDIWKKKKEEKERWKRWWWRLGVKRVEESDDGKGWRLGLLVGGGQKLKWCSRGIERQWVNNVFSHNTRVGSSSQTINGPQKICLHHLYISPDSLHIYFPYNVQLFLNHFSPVLSFTTSTSSATKFSY